MEDDCVTGWRWLQTTAPAASAHRVSNITNNEKYIVKKHYCQSYYVHVITDLLVIIFGSVGYIVIIIKIMLITSTLIHLHYSTAYIVSPHA